MKALLAALIAVFISYGPANAQKAVEPEACILDTLKGSGAREAVAMVRINCVRQYIKAVQKDAASLPVDQFKSSSLQHYNAIQGIPTDIPEKVVVSLKNDSSMRIIMADIILVNKKTKATHQFRAIADTPVDPSMIDTMTATINIGIKDFSEWTWMFQSVWGVPLRTD
jgi:hypothetical protein